MLIVWHISFANITSTLACKRHLPLLIPPCIKASALHKNPYMAQKFNRNRVVMESDCLTLVKVLRWGEDISQGIYTFSKKVWIINNHHIIHHRDGQVSNIVCCIRCQTWCTTSLGCQIVIYLYDGMTCWALRVIQYSMMQNMHHRWSQLASNRS